MPLDRITFATFNLLNLTARGQGTYDDPPLPDEIHDRKIRWIRGVLFRLEADVVGLQEFWHPGAMNEVLDDDGLRDRYDVLYPPEARPGRDMACGALVRRGLTDPAAARWIEGFPQGFRLRTEGRRKVRNPDGPGEVCPPPDAPALSPGFEVTLGSYSRPVLQFALDPGDGREPMVVFVCHLKSKLGTAIDCDAWYLEDEALHRPRKAALGSALSTIRRTAEAAALRSEMKAVMDRSRTPVVLLGDVNDGQDSTTLSILTGDAVYSHAARDPTAEGAALYSVQGIQEARSLRDVFYTYIRNGVHSSLDNILVSQEFYDFSEVRSWIMTDLRILNDHLDRDWDERKSQVVSDHGIVRARFAWAPAPAPAPVEGEAPAPVT